MFRHALSFTLALLLVFTLTSNVAFAQEPSPETKYKQTLVKWGTNKQIKVKLKSGEKINGRLADIKDEFFEVQSVSKEGKVTSRQLNYSEVKSLSAKINGGKIAGYTILGIAAGVGITALIVIAAIAAND